MDIYKLKETKHKMFIKYVYKNSYIKVVISENNAYIRKV